MAMPMAVRPFEMVPLGKPIELVRIQSPPIASLEFTIYVAADTLRSARLTTVSAEWEVFREHASAAVNRTISKNDLASLVKHGPYTIKRALGEAGVNPPRNMKVISDLEAFMAKMYAEQFRNLDARLAVVMRKRKKASPPETEGDEEPSKRSRTSLSKLGKEFIDYYRYRCRYRPGTGSGTGSGTGPSPATPTVATAFTRPSTTPHLRARSRSTRAAGRPRSSPPACAMRSPIRTARSRRRSSIESEACACREREREREREHNL